MYKLASLILCTSLANAIPTMAIPGLVYTATDSSSIATQVKNRLPGFNADVRGAIISSGQFKVVDLPKKVASNTSVKLPDYILSCVVSSIKQNEEDTPIKYTNNHTNQYNVDIAVDYKLIKTSDNSVMSSFTAYGHANDVKIIAESNMSQIQHNIPQLIKTASKDLGADVITELNEQFVTSSENYNNGSKVVTDVKVYN